MKTIEVCPSTLRPGFSTYSPQAVKELFDGVAVSPFIDIDFENERDQQQAMENMNNMSISGAQEKFSAIIDDGKIRLAHKGEQATYILKPAPFNLSLSTRKQIPANEHLTMQIASQVYGIRTASNGLCFSSSGQPVYITKRFDVINGVKESSQEDFATVLQMTEEGSDSNFKYHGNYAQIADAIRQFVPAWMPQMEQFFRMVVFDYLFANEDAHMKNFSLINRNGEYFLAPAYDLINTCIHIQSGSDLGLMDGLSPDISVLDMFMEIPQETYALIDHSFLNDKMKRTYKRVIEERKTRFIRQSE